MRDLPVDERRATKFPIQRETCPVIIPIQRETRMKLRSRPRGREFDPSQRERLWRIWRVSDAYPKVREAGDGLDLCDTYKP